MEDMTKALKAIIVDDEKRCVDLLSMDLKQYCPEVELLGGYTSSKDGLMAIKKLRPNLIFLDIEMPWMNGFELLELIGEPFFEVIFTTAYDQFAVKAFQCSAIDYLLKPIDSEDLVKAVHKAVQKVDKPLTQAHVDMLMKNLKDSSSRISRLVLPTVEGYEFVLVNDIMYCQADSNYTKVTITNGKSFMVSRPLKDLQGMLADYAFCRIHQSYLVNINHIEHYTRGDGGFITMVDNTVLSVARAKKEEFLDRINKT